MIARHPDLRHLTALLASVTFLACGGSGSDAPVAEVEAVPLPLTIQGMLRVNVMTGPEAAGMLGRMHGDDVAPTESYVGRYRSETGKATLYLSRFADPEGADSLLGEMSDSIGEGSRAFAHHTRFEVGGRTIHMVLGQGQVHFFFARNNELVWLGIDAPLARPGLAEVLGITEEDLPDRVELEGMGAPPPTGSSTGDTAPGAGGTDPEEGE